MQFNNPASTKNMTTLHLRKSIGRAPLRLGLFLIPVALGWFALSQTVRAQLPSPTPDGSYPGNNTAEGNQALFSLTTGAENTALGAGALFSNTTGNDNTATGHDALAFNTTGFENTATGASALFNNTTGRFNTANGFEALWSNTTGNSNTANGFQALFNNTTSGAANTATGSQALLSNTTGNGNTANGASALQNNTTGSFNTANGIAALASNTTGSSNTANGPSALLSNTTGGNNSANGDNALYSNTTGNLNTANGLAALFSNTTGGSNIGLGVGAGDNLTTGSNNIDIGNAGVAAEGTTIRIGTVGTQTKTFIAGISGAGVIGVAVKVNAAGQLGTAPSSERFKDAIRPMDKTSEAILGLKPVTFHYKKELDPEGIPQFGLVAEEVEKVNPDLVAHDADGKVYTVRYEAVNAMLLNEFLKEHRKVEQQEATITELKSTVAQQQKDFQATGAHQQKQIETLAAGLQKVSAQVELKQPLPQIVVNSP